MYSVVFILIHLIDYNCEILFPQLKSCHNAVYFIILKITDIMIFLMNTFFPDAFEHYLSHVFVKCSQNLQDRIPLGTAETFPRFYSVIISSLTGFLDSGHALPYLS